MHKSGFYRHRLVLAVVLLALGMAFSGGLLAGKDERAQMIRDLFENFILAGMVCEKASLSTYFSADIVKHVLQACDADEELEYNIIPGNDFDNDEVMRTLKVEPVSGSAYRASFSNFGTPETVTYTFEKQGGKWRITDVD